MCKCTVTSTSIQLPEYLTFYFSFSLSAIPFPLKDLCQGLTSTSTISLSVYLSDYQSLLRKSLWSKMFYVCLQLYHMLQKRILFCDGMTNRMMLRKLLKRNATEKEAAGKSPLQNNAPKAAFDHSVPQVCSFFLEVYGILHIFLWKILEVSL